MEKEQILKLILIGVCLIIVISLIFWASDVGGSHVQTELNFAQACKDWIGTGCAYDSEMTEICSQVLQSKEETAKVIQEELEASDASEKWVLCRQKCPGCP